MISRGAVIEYVAKALGENLPAAQFIAALARLGIQAWLVGGAARDALFGRPITDMDLVINEDPAQAAEALGRHLGYSIFALDSGRGFYRLTSPKPESFTVDLCRMRGGSIGRDLSSRDFTLNAIAIGLGPAPVLADPFDGIGDLEKKMLRPVSQSCLADDPLRILRAYRLALIHELQPAAGLSSMIRSALAGLSGVAGERILMELTKITKEPDSHKAIAAMEADGALRHIFPSAGSGALGDAQLLARLETILAGYPDRRYLSEPMGAGMTRQEVVKLASLFSPLADSTGESGQYALEAAHRWKAPRAVAIGMKKMVSGWIGCLRIKDETQVYDWLCGVEDWAQGALMLAQAIANETQLMNVEWFEATLGKIQGRLATAWPPDDPPVSGRDIIQTLGVAPGPQVARLLGLAKRAVALGEPGGREQALEYMRREMARP
ncbi:MAG: hypothetical protein OEV92_08345 [Nitrospinota bacterium]|nr:hypothetical protein [Nitrospinota bacterium]